MTKPQRVLLEYLSEQDPQAIRLDILETFTANEMSELFVDLSFLVTAMPFVKEERWLQKIKNNFPEFMTQLFEIELAPILFLKRFLEATTLEGSETIGENAIQIEKSIVTAIKEKPFEFQKEFAICALKIMSEMFDVENKMQLEKKEQGKFLGLSLYRTFDRLDDIFNLNYKADLGMKHDLKNTERLYEEAGVGVQSSYLTVLMALKSINPNDGDRFIDLGSGYGRLGLVIGLMRPDMNFIGYEFVKHRVDISNVSAENLKLQNKVQFFTQDLSLKDFQIPDAEIYYMYDPFSKDTYEHVLKQLIDISKRKKITIVTKGNARSWLFDIAKKEGWSQTEEHGEGNLCVFKS